MPGAALLYIRNNQTHFREVEQRGPGSDGSRGSGVHGMPVRAHKWSSKGCKRAWRNLRLRLFQRS